MNYFKVKSAGLIGNKLLLVEIECIQQRRLPFLQIIGGPTAAHSAQRERIMAALESSGFKLPSRRFTVSMIGANSGMATESTDLAVALALLGSCGHISQEKLVGAIAFGGLSLEGKILAATDRAPLRQWLDSRQNISVFLPWEDSYLLKDSQNGGGFRSLREVVSFLAGNFPRAPRAKSEQAAPERVDESFWRFLKRQPVAQRLAEVAAAGKHPLLLSGGSGEETKLLARAIHGLLSPVSARMREEISAIHRSYGEDGGDSRPFREVRSDQANRLFRFDAPSGRWGDLSLAHGGVLFLSDLGDKPQSQLARLQEPLDSGFIRGFRQGQSISQPVDWHLIASCQLCPCGMESVSCGCTPGEIEKYRNRLDLVRGVFQLRFHFGKSIEVGREASLIDAKARVERASSLAESRGCYNGRLSLARCFEVKDWSEEAVGQWRSANGFYLAGMGLSLARLAVTLSDLKGASEVSREDILEARHYLPSPFGSISRSGRSLSSMGEVERNSTAIP